MPLVARSAPNFYPVENHHVDNDSDREQSNINWIDDRMTSNCSQCNQPFTFFRRRHHCRRCGLIYCARCSNNRITRLCSPEDYNYYRICNYCLDDLIASGLAIIRQSRTCSLWMMFSYRQVAAIRFDPQASDNNNSLNGQNMDEQPLIRFDEEEEEGQTIVEGFIVSPNPQRLPPSQRCANTSGNFGLLAKFWSLFSSSTPQHHQTSRQPTPQSTNSLSQMNTCPVCSLSLRKWDVVKRQNHVEGCIKRAEIEGIVSGDRYSTFTWNHGDDKAEEWDCPICYEAFERGQSIAVLNCLCQYHERCIEAWFERGKNCPFHFGQ